MSWPLVPIKELFIAHYGKALKKEERDDAGPHAVYGSSGCIGVHSNRTINKETIVVGRKGSVGEVIWAPDGGWVIDTAFYLERKSEVVIDLRYSYYALKKANLSSRTITTSIPGLNRDDLYETKIPLPPLKEQKRIAAILDKADAISRKRQQAIKLADDFLRSVFLDMFGDPVSNPKGWEETSLTQLINPESIITYGIVQAGPHVEGGIPYIRTGDFKNGKLADSGYACTTSEIASKFKRSQVSTGDLVYCIRASIGAVDIVPAHLDGANLTQGTAKISPAHDVCSEFLVHLMRTAGFRSWIDRNSKGATFKEITLATLRDAPVYKPPYALQKKFSLIMARTDNYLLTSYEKMKMPLFESLGEKVFSGKM